MLLVSVLRQQLREHIYFNFHIILMLYLLFQPPQELNLAAMFSDCNTWTGIVSFRFLCFWWCFSSVVLLITVKVSVSALVSELDVLALGAHVVHRFEVCATSHQPRHWVPLIILSVHAAGAPTEESLGWVPREK